MEVSKLLKNVNSLNKYIAVTQDISNKYINAKIQFNMSSVLSLKKIRSLEIEYFNKSEDNGAACIIFERMLKTPPTKTWNILGKELVQLLQYWLDAIRKHLISHSIHWWTFLKLLLRFIKDIRTKDSSIPNLLVELLAECLLDVATNDRPDPSQRREVLACLNIFCAESGREIRFAMRNKFGNYFVKLSWYMCTCGHVPCQYSALETLVRWLLPRHEPAVRLAAADKWLPLHLCKDVARDVFLKRPWMDFFQDARAFLNAHNNSGDLITSVAIRKMTIGPITIITGTEKRETWLDINTAQNCISVLLEVKVLEAIGVMIETSCEALVISCDDVDNAQLSRESPEVIISLRVLHTPCMTSSFKFPDVNDDTHDVTLVISSRCDLKNVDKALRGAFGDKYQLLLDLDKELPLSPEYTRNITESGEDSRLSHPAEVRRRKHSGYIVGSRNPGAWRSPSTASTSSLAQLHEKLAALPRYRFEKEQVSVCVKPELSSVTELSETDDKHSLNNTSTLKLRPYGVCYKGLNTKVDSNRKSQSDSEGIKHKSKTRNLSPVVNESAASCLLVATIGSDESVINETLERLGKNKDYNTDNIVDLLVQEALHSKQIQEKDKLLDSGINTGENKKTQELQRIVEEIDNTPCDDITTKAQKVPCTVISRSTSDESNTEVVNETPDYVSVRRKPVKPKPKQPETKKNANEITFDINAVEEFFSQHFTENRAGEIAISPTLAKKINETSSESSDFEDHYLIINDNFNTIVENIETVNDIDIIECLNTMVDNVCNDFDKCTEYLNQENDEMNGGNEKLLQEVTNTVEVKSNETARTPRKSIKLKYKVVRKKDNPKQKATLKKRKKVEKSKMSTIMEDNEVTTVMNTNNEACEIEPERKIATPDNRDNEARSMRRKRKLYSPKDIENKIDANQITHNPIMKKDESKNDEEMPLSEVKRITRNKTPKSSATCYKEIETERRNRVRQPRKRISYSKITSPPSPKTHKMNILFDKLKETVESSEKITIADKMMGNDMYNFTSESEDEDFKRKTIITKRNSTITVGSLESSITTRQGRRKRVNYSENISSNDDNKVSKKKAPARRNKVVKRRNSKNKINIELQIELVDERMRQAVQEELNTSLITEKRKLSIDKEPELVLEKAPEMEIIADKEKITKKRTNKKNKKTALDVIKIQREHASKKADIEIMSNNEDDGTLSPLPGLVVESVPLRHDDENCSISANMLQKYKKIYQEGTDACINESNTTQNLLSDIERINVSTNKNVTNEIDLNADENFDNIQTIDRTDKEQIETDSTNSVVKSVKSYKTIKSYNKSSLKLKNIDRNVKCKIETIQLNDKSEAKRRSVSITTVGITGHGELDESPPNVNLLHEKLKPRNLSIDEFNQSMKDYYAELTNEINKCGDMINVVEAPEIEPKINSDSIKSPVVSIQRLSFDDISKWLPSRRNSDSDQTSSIDHNSLKGISQPNSKAAKVMVKNKSKETDQSSNEYKIIKLKKSHVANRPSSETTRSSSADKNVSEKIIEIESIQTRSKTKVNRKSMISPIKLFDDCQPNLNMKSDSSNNECVKNVRNIFTKNKYTKRSESTKKYSLENAEIRDQESCSSLDSKVSTPTKVYGTSKCGLKRKSSPILIEVKKKKTNVDAEEIAIGSVPSTSTVYDWLNRNEPTGSRAERINLSFNDSIQNILEKLDTTLVEIQQNTSKQFVHMFVEAQNYLSQMKENRRSMYKQVATDVVKEMVKIMDNKFADLDRRSQEMDSDFMSQLKDRATEFIREDSKRKHAMVLLLREDVQSVIDHINKERRLDSP